MLVGVGVVAQLVAVRERDPPAQRVRRLALVEHRGDPAPLEGVGVVAEREVRPDEPPVLLQRRGERRLRRLRRETADQKARGDPAALQRAGGAQQVVPAVGDQLVADLAAPSDVDREVGAGRTEAVEALVG